VDTGFSGANEEEKREDGEHPGSCTGVVKEKSNGEENGSKDPPLHSRKMAR
jgi:ribosome assembly protein YihI (activator of Der GTPase)